MAGCVVVWFWGLEPALYTRRWCGKMDVGRLRPPPPIIQRIIMANVMHIDTVNVFEAKRDLPQEDSQGEESI